MDVFHHHLKAVKAASFRDLDFCCESLGKIFEHNTIRSSKESENMLDEVLFVLGEFFPILNILSKINFLSSPESSFLVFVHPPNVMVLNRKEDEAVRVLFKKRFWERSLSLSVL